MQDYKEMRAELSQYLREYLPLQEVFPQYYLSGMANQAKKIIQQENPSKKSLSRLEKILESFKRNFKSSKEYERYRPEVIEMYKQINYYLDKLPQSEQNLKLKSRGEQLSGLLKNGCFFDIEFLRSLNDIYYSIPVYEEDRDKMLDLLDRLEEIKDSFWTSIQEQRQVSS